MARSKADAVVWLREMYDEHFDAVDYAVKHLLEIYHMDPELAGDYVHDVFMRAFRRYDKLIDHPNVGGWLVKTAELTMLNEARKDIKRRRKTTKLEAVYLEEPLVESAEMSYLNMLEEHDPEAAEEVIHEIRSQLPVRDDLLYEQYYKKQMPLTELSKTYGVSETAVRLRVSRVAKKMRRMVKIYFQTE